VVRRLWPTGSDPPAELHPELAKGTTRGTTQDACRDAAQPLAPVRSCERCGRPVIFDASRRIPLHAVCGDACRYAVKLAQARARHARRPQPVSCVTCGKSNRSDPMLSAVLPTHTGAWVIETAIAESSRQSESHEYTCPAAERRGKKPRTCHGSDLRHANPLPNLRPPFTAPGSAAATKRKALPVSPCGCRMNHKKLRRLGSSQQPQHRHSLSHSASQRYGPVCEGRAKSTFRPTVAPLGKRSESCRDICGRHILDVATLWHVPACHGRYAGCDQRTLGRTLGLALLLGPVCTAVSAGGIDEPTRRSPNCRHRRLRRRR
jgi:hypothetical protein